MRIAGLLLVGVALLALRLQQPLWSAAVAIGDLASSATDWAWQHADVAGGALALAALGAAAGGRAPRWWPVPCALLLLGLLAIRILPDRVASGPDRPTRGGAACTLRVTRAPDRLGFGATSVVEAAYGDMDRAALVRCRAQAPWAMLTGIGFDVTPPDAQREANGAWRWIVTAQPMRDRAAPSTRYLQVEAADIEARLGLPTDARRDPSPLPVLVGAEPGPFGALRDGEAISRLASIVGVALLILLARSELRRPRPSGAMRKWLRARGPGAT